MFEYTNMDIMDELEVAGSRVDDIAGETSIKSKMGSHKKG